MSDVIDTLICRVNHDLLPAPMVRKAICRLLVNSRSRLTQRYAVSGGYAISIEEITDKSQMEGMKKI